MTTADGHAACIPSILVPITREEIRRWLASLEGLAADDPEAARDELQETPAVVLITAAHVCCGLEEELDADIVSGLRVLLLDERISRTPDALPDELLDAWIEQLCAPSLRWPDCYLAPILDWLSRHPQVARRVRAAEALPETASDAPDLVDQALRRLVDDGVSPVRNAAESALPAVLERTPACKQAEMTASWSISRSPAHRAALARAIAHGLGGVGVPSALEHLADDVHPEVRRSAVEAAFERIGDFPRRARKILSRGAKDRDPGVRSAAERALRMCRNLPSG